MTVLQEILQWTTGLPAWQGDCVRRLLVQQSLSQQDVDDVLALLKATHGIADAQGRQAKQLTEDQIPAALKATTHIELHAIKNLLNVNAIAQNHSLAFAPIGLTVIYGGNGSGKSGYSRVLKRACRARDQAETIYPDANQRTLDNAPAQATFTVSVNGTVNDVLWTDNQTAPPELSSFSIFDSRCANAYLVNEADYSYVPQGLDVFERLATLHQQLKIAVEKEQREYAVDLGAFAGLNGPTEVGKLMAGLSAKTNPTSIQKLGTLTEEELNLRTSIRQSLQENNPKEKAVQLRRLGQRITAIAANSSNRSAQISDEVGQVLRQSVTHYLSAKSAAELAANQFKEQGGLLQGTGEEVWRELFESARKFAYISHPGQHFKTLSPDSPCPLCQQPLNEGAARIALFEEFIQQEAEKNSQARRKEMVAHYTPVAACEASIGLDEATAGEIRALSEELVAACREFERSLGERRDSLVAAVKSNNWSDVPRSPVSPAADLLVLAEKVNLQALTHEQASDEAARNAIQKQYTELEARFLLSQVKDAVITVISKLNHTAMLAKCILALKTNAISTKSSQIGETVISKSLQDALNAEFKALGVGALQVALQSRSGKGKMLHKLKLELPQSRNPRDLLSEGEQRAIALASFLAEVGLSNNSGGVIFDDPVSSLDHRRREKVATRLVEEAKSRQVIVFTHDIYFLCILAEQADAAGVAAQTQSISRRAEGFGVSNPELPFEGKNTTRRIASLRAHQQQVAKLFRNGEEDEHRKQTSDAYFHLRLAWERAVEEVLLRRVVLRFRKGVETQRLSEVLVNDDDYSRVTEGMSKCSNYAHDKAMEGGIAVPDPEELLQDIMNLDAWRAEIEKRSEATKRARRS